MASDWADPYTYPGTDGVLANKHGIRDAAELKSSEYDFAAARTFQLREKPITGNFDLDHLKAIHGHIFQDTYEWAGQTRVVNLSKGGSSFARARDIEVEAGRLADSLAKGNHLRGLEKPQFVEQLTQCHAALNALHPFREGNGRSTREFIGQLAKQAGYELDQTRIDNGKEQWNDAAKRAMTGDLAGLKEIFTEAVRPSRAQAFDKLPEDQALAKHPELRGAYDSLRAMRDSLAQRYPDNEQARKHFADQARAEIVRRLDAGKAPPAPTLNRQDTVAAPSGPDRAAQAPAAPERPGVAPSAPPKELPARAKAFQAVADDKLSRDDALKFYPELRPAFNQLAVAKMRFAASPQDLHALREGLQARLNTGEIPAAAGPSQALQRQQPLQRQPEMQR
jgi:cell filamentation protein